MINEKVIKLAKLFSIDIFDYSNVNYFFGRYCHIYYYKNRTESKRYSTFTIKIIRWKSIA